MGLIWGKDGFSNSKIASRKVISDNIANLGIDKPGNYSKKISLKSTTPAAINPTTDSDDNNPRASANNPGYGINIAAGASGDKSMGYPWKGAGQDTLNGAQANNAKRGLAYGN